MVKQNGQNGVSEALASSATGAKRGRRAPGVDPAIEAHAQEREPSQRDVTEARKRQIEEASKSSSKIVTIRIVGISPFVPKQMSREHNILDMLRDHMGKPKKREKKVPIQDAVACLHLMEPHKLPQTPQELIDLSPEDCMQRVALPFLDGVRIGCPAGSFRHALNRRGKYMKGIHMVDLANNLFVFASEPQHRNLVEIHVHETPYMWLDYVRNDNKSPDVRARIWYPRWSADLRIRYSPSVTSLDQVVKLAAEAGEFGGVGEHRGGCGGQNGLWQVDGVSY